MKNKYSAPISGIGRLTLGFLFGLIIMGVIVSLFIVNTFDYDNMRRGMETILTGVNPWAPETRVIHFYNPPFAAVYLWVLEYTSPQILLVLGGACLFAFLFYHKAWVAAAWFVSNTFLWIIAAGGIDMLVIGLGLILLLTNDSIKTKDWGPKLILRVLGYGLLMIKPQGGMFIVALYALKRRDWQAPLACLLFYVFLLFPYYPDWLHVLLTDPPLAQTEASHTFYAKFGMLPSLLVAVPVLFARRWKYWQLGAALSAILAPYGMPGVPIFLILTAVKQKTAIPAIILYSAGLAWMTWIAPQPPLMGIYHLGMLSMALILACLLPSNEPENADDIDIRVLMEKAINRVSHSRTTKTKKLATTSVMDHLRAVEISEIGMDAGQGNLLGIQPFMERADYASEAAFYNRLDGCFRQAQHKGWLNPRTVVTLPEYLGTWLVVADENPSVLSARTVTAAMQPLVLNHLGRFAWALLNAKEKDRVKASLFRVKAVRMAAIYQSVFSRLAREYAVTIAAGSILLPNPRVEDGQVQAGDGPFYNVSFLFRADGRADPRPTRKIFPIADELPFIKPSPAGDQPVYDTPAGRLGVLVCADSWFPEAYLALQAQNVELIAVPSASSHGQAWYQSWGGYSGWPAAPDVDASDIGKITEQEAWGRYALAGRMAGSGARAGINVFLYGDLWDLDFVGGRWRVVLGEMNIEAGRDGAALVNLWL